MRYSAISASFLIVAGVLWYFDVQSWQVPAFFGAVLVFMQIAHYFVRKYER